METLKIDILNPKAKKLLDSLAELKLIRINPEKEASFTNLMDILSSKSDEKITLEEITKEVEAVRKARYEK